MSFFEYPSSVPYVSLEKQVREINSFLTRLVENLNHNIESESAEAYLNTVLSFEQFNKSTGGEAEKELTQTGFEKYNKTFNNLKDLIIASAHTVIENETEPIVNRFTKEYEAISDDFGTFKTQVQTDITQSANGLSILSTRVDGIDSDIDMFKGKASFINLGWLENDNTWGIDIGQIADTFTVKKANGQELDFSNLDKFFTRITPQRMSFMFQPVGGEASELAYLSTTAINFPNANITGGTIGIGVIGEDLNHNPIYNFYVDDNGNVTARSLSLSYSQITDPPNLSNYALSSDLNNYVVKGGAIQKVGQTPGSGTTGFQVSSAGLLEASNAVIYGNIYASGGTIGGWSIASNGIQKVDGNLTYTIGGANTFLHSSYVTDVYKLGTNGKYITNSSSSIVPFLVYKNGSARFNSINAYGKIKTYGDISFGKENPHLYVDIYPSTSSLDPVSCSMLAFTSDQEDGSGNNLVLGTKLKIGSGNNASIPFNSVVIRGGEGGIILDCTESNNSVIEARGDLRVKNSAYIDDNIYFGKGKKIFYAGANGDINLLGTTIDSNNNNNFTALVLGATNLTCPVYIRTSADNIVLSPGGSGKAMYGSNEIATVNQIPSLIGYATQTWVGNNYLSKSGGSVSGNIELEKGVKIGYMSGSTWYNFLGTTTTTSNNNTLFDKFVIGGSNTAIDMIIRNFGSSHGISIIPGNGQLYLETDNGSIYSNAGSTKMHLVGFSSGDLVLGSSSLTSGDIRLRARKAYYGSNEIATVNQIPSLSGYATQTWVGNNYLSKSGGDMSGHISLNNGYFVKGKIGSDEYLLLGLNTYNHIQIGESSCPGNILLVTSGTAKVNGNEIVTRDMLKSSAFN